MTVSPNATPLPSQRTRRELESDALRAALQLPWPAFFCIKSSDPKRNKRPACPNGFKDACQGDELVTLHRRYRGDLIGVPTGAASGVSVLDVDPDKGGHRWLDANRAQLPATRQHETQRGGLHFLFNHRPGLRCSASKIALGIDVRGDGVFARMAQQGKVSAFPVPMITLASQAYDRFTQYGLTSLGIIQARNPRTKRNAALQICSIATLAARRNQGKRELDNLGLVIVDEAHIKSAEIFQLMAEWPDVVFIGLSATPWSKGLGLHWKKLIVCETIAGLIEHGKENPKEGLCEFESYAPGIVPELGKVKLNIEGNDYDTASLAKVMNNNALVGDIVKVWKERGQDRLTFCFTVNRAHGKHVNRCFVEAGVASEYMDGETKAEDREEIFKRYRAGVTRIIVSIGVLTAGVDEDVRCIIMARPTKSPILWVQMIGRGLRRSEGKDHLLILDHTLNSTTLGTVETIFFDGLHDGSRGVDLWSDEEREAAAEARAAKPVVCHQCKAIIPRGLTKCPKCGHEFRPVCNVEVVEGDLVKLGSGEQGRLGATHGEQQRFYQECLGYAAEREWSPGAAYHQTIAKFPSLPRPPWAWRNLEPLTPSPATINELKRQWIARRARASR